jgi:hypothetical protein
MKIEASVTAFALLAQVLGCAYHASNAPPPGTLRLWSYGTEVGSYPVDSRRISAGSCEATRSCVRTTVIQKSTERVGAQVAAIGAGLALAALIKAFGGGAGSLADFGGSVAMHGLGGPASVVQREERRTVVRTVGEGMSGVFIGEPQAGK